ncbi:major facilitator superfamily domain-containing protein [Trichoderma barbatum]
MAYRRADRVGTGGMNALVQLILTDIAPLAERPKYTGIVTLFSAFGLVIGGLCGAAIVQHTTWPLVFWINLPICVPVLLTFCSHSYLGAAVLMLPATLTFPPAAAITGHIIGRTLKYQLANIIGFAFLAGGLSGLANLNESSSAGLQVGLLLIMGTGFGIPFISKVFMAQTAVAEDDQYMATAIVATVTSVGECFGVAISSTTFQNKWDALLEKEMKRTALKLVIKGSDAERSASLITTMDKATASFYQHIAMKSFQTVWIVLGSLAGVALILSLFIRDPRPKETAPTESSVEAIILDKEKP